MPQSWAKQGLLLSASADRPWMMTHAALPLAHWLRDDVFRVYFCSRDASGRAQIGQGELELGDPPKILSVSEQPCIGLGRLGAFDDSGATSSWLVVHEGRQYQYYTGWSLGVTVPFYFYIGLAVSDDNGASFHKVSEAPILERSSVDPFLTASPCVLIEDGAWRMWYVSAVRWELRDGQPMHYYHVRYAESADGIHWRPTGVVCIDFQSEDEYAIARPCVLKDGDLYKMWYCCRGKAYRIGYAESADGLRWQRRDAEAGIDVSETGWDSEMLAYPFVFDHKGRRFMLYNGNRYGQTGFGLACLQDRSLSSGS